MKVYTRRGLNSRIYLGWNSLCISGMKSVNIRYGLCTLPMIYTLQFLH